MTNKRTTPEDPAKSQAEELEDKRQQPITEAGALLPALLGSMRQLITRAGAQISRWEEFLTGSYKATYGIAVTRILMGLTGLGVLLTNYRSRHYSFGVGSAWNGEIEQPISDFPNIWLFSLFHQVAATPWLFTLLYIGLAILAVVVILGWRTRIILPFYLVFWVSFIEINDAAGDQGDNAYRMFLVAMLFTNSSMRWSLDARRRTRVGKPAAREDHPWAWAPITAHNLALVVLAFQVCAIYVSGGLYKAGGDPWAHGWAIYDPLQTAQFGTWPVLSDLLTTWGPMVVVVTWTSLMFQIAFPFLLFNRYTKIIALLGILSFHIGIGVLMGLPWFSLTMIAVDAIFIRDRSYKRLGRWLGFIRRSLSSGDLASSSAKAEEGKELSPPSQGVERRQRRARPPVSR